MKTLFQTSIDHQNSVAQSVVDQRLVNQAPVNQSSVNQKVVGVDMVIEVHCPNCGSYAERHHLIADHLIRTQCPACDYLMITCAQTGRVVEAYAPGIFARS